MTQNIIFFFYKTKDTSQLRGGKSAVIKSYSSVSKGQGVSFLDVCGFLSNDLASHSFHSEEDGSPTDPTRLRPAAALIHHRYRLTITGFGKSGLRKCNLFRKIKQIFVACHIQLHRHGRGPWKRVGSGQGNRKIDAD